MPRDVPWQRGTSTTALLRLLGDGAEADAVARAPLVSAIAHVLDGPPNDVPAVLGALLEALPGLRTVAVIGAGPDGWSVLASAGSTAPARPLPRDLLEHGSLARALQEPGGAVLSEEGLPPGLLPEGTRTALALAPGDVGDAPACLVVLGWPGDRPPKDAETVVARVAAERVVRVVEAERLAARAAETAGRTGGFRDQVLAIVGHDLRNPLGAIVMSAALLRSRGGLEGWQARTVERVQSSAMRMGRIIDDLLSYTRTRLGEGIPVWRAPEDLGAIARRIVDELRVAHPQAVIDLHAAGHLSGSWDAARLEQVISNLVSNAIDHGDDDAPVTVTIEPADGAVRLAVENRGEMPPGTIEHAFEAFHRGPEETGRKASGLGLGLFIAREIVRRHGGEIQVDSGRGSTRVVAVLPRA